MKMQMLVVLAVAVLVVPSLSEGRILSKCELKSLLEEPAFKFNLTEKARERNLTNEDFVAKSFNTSFVTSWRDDDGPDDCPTRPAKNVNRPTRPTLLTHPKHPPRRALIDDDISDDLDCVETIKQTVESGPDEHKMALMR
ncbi:unnamed protein product, partial [Coregonus sp. 'balchen']